VRPKTLLSYKLALIGLILNISVSSASEDNNSAYMLDRVYTSDQNSNTVSVYHPGTREVLGRTWIP